MTNELLLPTTTLPQVEVRLPSTIVLEAPTLLQKDANDLAAKEADLPTANNLIQLAHLFLTQVDSLSALEKAVDVTIKTTEHRRYILGLEYAPTAKIPRGGLFDPID